MTLSSHYAQFTLSMGMALSPAGFVKTAPGFLREYTGAMVGCRVNSRKWSTPDCKRFSITLEIWWKTLDKYRLFPRGTSGWPGEDADRVLTLSRPAGVPGEDMLWHMDEATNTVALGAAVQHGLDEWIAGMDDLVDIASYESFLARKNALSEVFTIEHVKQFRLLVERGDFEGARALCAAWQATLPPAHYKRQWLADQLDELLRTHAASK